jgi:uncharacterized delta-60 repeat protein
MKKNLLGLSLLFLFQFQGQAQLNGVLDETFANAGIYTYDFGFVDVLYGIELQEDGKIVAAGSALDATYTSEAKVLRLLPDGTPDMDFGTNGIVDLPLNEESYAYDLLIKDNGQLLIAGISAIQPYVYAMAITQLNSDGSIDTSFGTNGTTIINLGNGDEYAYAIALQADGKILVAGNSLDANYNNVPTLVRLTTEGDLDLSFSEDGVAFYPVSQVENELRSVAVQSDGKIIVGGHYAPDLFDVDVLLLRFNEDGTLDETFGVEGALEDPITPYGADECFGLIIDAQDNIIITGYASTASGWDAFVKKYDSFGATDNSFGTDGVVFSGVEQSDVGYAIVQAPSGDFVFCGTAGNFPDQAFALWSIHADGTLDADFGTNGTVLTSLGPNPTEATALAIQDDSSIFIAGKTGDQNNNLQFAILKYQDGLTSIGETQDNDTFTMFPNPVQAGGMFTLNSSLEQKNITRVDWLNMLGETIYSQQTQKTGSFTNAVPTVLSAGCYEVRCFDGSILLGSKKMMVTK